MSIQERVAGAPAEVATRVPSHARAMTTLMARRLRDERRALLYWGGAIGALGALMTAIWPSLQGTIDDLMRSYPENIRAAFGIERLDTVELYVEAEMLSIVVPLALAFFAIRSASRSTVGAEDRGHIDTLLSLPVSRRAVVAASFLVSAIMTFAILAVAGALTWIAGTLAGTGISAVVLARGFANVWPLAVAFAGFAVLLTGLVSRQAVVTGIAMGTAVSMYMVDVAGKMAPAMETLRSLSAFRYYGSAVQDGIELSHAVGLVVVGSALAAIGAMLFDRRDIR